MAEESVPKPEDVYKIYRDYIEHEDDLTHQRTTSFVTIQAFTIATFGLSFQKRCEILAKPAWDRDSGAGFQRVTNELNAIMLFLVFIGATTSFIAWRSVRAAVLAIKRLEAEWNCFAKRYPTTYLPGITGGGDSSASKSGELFPLYAPILAMILWILTFLVLYFAFDIRVSFKGAT